MSFAKKENTVWTIESLAKYVSEIVGKESGNVFGENQQSMVLSRLKKRLIDLGNMTPGEYYDYLCAHFEEESTCLIGIIWKHYCSNNQQHTHHQSKHHNENICN